MSEADTIGGANAPGHAMNRRQFLARTGGVIGAAAVAGVPLPPGAAHSKDTSGTPERLARIGVQLYTVRDAMQADFEQTLARVATIGYQEVEFAGYFGRTAKQVRAVLDANGLTSPSAHSADLPSIRTRLAGVLDDAATIGQRYVICASLPRSEQSADGFRRVAAEFNRAGEVAAKSGITLGYHNHDFEFQLAGGAPLYDILLAECDPKLVTMQMDLYWITRGGQDPLAYFAKYPGRFSSVHVKDMDASGAMAAAGSGRLPFASYFARSKQAGIRHYFVEHDSPADAMASITSSFTYLKALQY